MASANPTILQRITSTDAPMATLLIRLLVGAVFLSEGIQKFLFPASVGAGRFERIGLPAPEFLGPLVGSVEIVCGALILLGLFTRIAAIPLIVIMVMAIMSTKIPILLGHGFWGFSLRELSHYGFWSMAHEMRTDWSMLLGSLFLLSVGAGRVSLDHRIASRQTKESEQTYSRDNVGGNEPRTRTS
jgi:putative oxidoreductase